jgi:hypothetical protein
MLESASVSPVSPISPRHEKRAGSVKLEIRSLDELMAFRAPYLEDKLVQEKILSSHEEVAAYLQEVKKYLVVSVADPSRSFPMISRMVDEVWHQFVLFTNEYVKFSMRFFGGYLHHAPSNAPKPENVPARPEAGRDGFIADYNARFGELSPLWDDAARLTVRSRVLREPVESLYVRKQGDRVELVSDIEGEPQVLVRIDAWGEAALRFLIENDVFYVRELPDRLHDEDKVLLVRMLLKRTLVFRVTV